MGHLYRAGVTIRLDGMRRAGCRAALMPATTPDGCAASSILLRRATPQGTRCESCIDQQLGGAGRGCDRRLRFDSRTRARSEVGPSELDQRVRTRGLGQKAIRAEEAIERRRTASIADRRVVYAKFLRAKRRLPEETPKRKQLNRRFTLPAFDLMLFRTKPWPVQRITVEETPSRAASRSISNPNTPMHSPIRCPVASMNRRRSRTAASAT